VNPPAQALAPLRQALGVTWHNEQLLLQALRHRSSGVPNNERLEFLGDAVLNLAVAHMLYQRCQSMSEGDLSRVRAHLVRQETLAQLAQQLGVPACLVLSEGEARSGGRERPSLLADALEAILGAVYLDQGPEAAQQVAAGWFANIDFANSAEHFGKDAKTALQEWLQARARPLPKYEVVATHGLAHQQQFEVICRVSDDTQQGQGLGPSRRAAEQAAAAVLLNALQQAAAPKHD